MTTRKIQRATITDVAKLAGVSISTVSRVLNETAPVSEDAVLRVRSAVEMLSFTPHAAARTLAVRKTDTVGLLLPEMASSFFVPTLRGIEAAVREAGLDLLIFAGDPNSPRRNESHQPLGEHNTDGLLVFANQLEIAEVTRLHQRGFPVVLLHRAAPAGLPIPSVRFDNRGGLRRLMHHLIVECGRRRILFLRGPEGNEDSFWRETAYRESLEVHGIPWRADLLANANFTEVGGEESVRNAIHANLEFDAVFAGDDEAAAGALMALRKCGKRVPEDVSLAGFDDATMARHLNPPLTTIRAPIETASYLAARYLVRLIRGEEVEINTQLPVELIIRESTCATHKNTAIHAAP